MAVLSPGDGRFPLGTSVVLIVLYAAARQVGFEIATGYTCPVILVLVPMLFLLPPQLVPAHVAAGLLIGALVSRARGRRTGARAVLAVGLSWHAVGPAIVFVVAGVTARSSPTGPCTCSRWGRCSRPTPWCRCSRTASGSGSR